MGHSWRFFRAGGFDQVKLETGADLVALGELDQKLWVALACPVKGLEFDQRTLELIDTDKDSRVRASELIAAVKWAGERLKDVETLAKGSSSLPLSVIQDAHPEGRLILETARDLLATLKKDEHALDVADTMHALEVFASKPFNGDGIFPAEATDDPELAQAIRDVIGTMAEPRIDRSGKPGVDLAAIETFWKELDAHVAWLDSGQTQAIRPLGERTEEAHAALMAVRVKVADYFTRCKVAAFDPRALAAVNLEQETYVRLAARDLDLSADELKALPLALVEPDRPLPLMQGLNPAWAQAISTLRERAVVPLLGERSELTEAQWDELCRCFRAYEAWLQKKPGVLVEKLGAARVRELQSGPLRQKLEELVRKDLAAEPLARSIESVERLVRYHRDLMRLANNFVSFRDFYARSWATFQAGTLYLDQRACDLCIRVDDPEKHGTMAPLAKSYLVYCDLRNAKGEKMSIVAAVTNGDVDNLMVGRNGVFYDRKGQDWDATVTKIIDNPISVRQAFWSPYKKLLRFIEEQLNRQAADAVLSVDNKLVEVVKPKDPKSSASPFDVGTVAALGVAVGGITAALGAMLQAFFGLGIWMPLGVIGIILLISGPSMAVAWLKLRQRNLGPLLDANGWAVNTQAKLNVPLGESLTKVASLPSGSRRDLTDPFAEKPIPWRRYATVGAIVALLLGFWLGKLDPYLPGPLKSVALLGEWSPLVNPELRKRVDSVTQQAVDVFHPGAKTPAPAAPSPSPAPAPAPAPAVPAN